MFKDNKYTAIYYNLIESLSTDVGEKHHIIPKSMGGDNSTSNLVTVSPRVHFILHKLLVKMVNDPKHKISMNYALFMMMNRKISNYTSRAYEKQKQIISEHLSKNNPMHNKETVNKFRKKRPEQSIVASKRNHQYWSQRARPVRKFNCPICYTSIETRIPTKTTCSKSCSAKLQHMK